MTWMAKAATIVRKNGKYTVKVSVSGLDEYQAANLRDAITPVLEVYEPGQDDSVPNEEGLKPFRKQYVALVKLLSENGLTSDTCNPPKKKVITFLLKTTGADSAEGITNKMWRTFFQVTNASNPKELVALVEAASADDDAGF